MLPLSLSADLTSWSFKTWLQIWLQAIGCLFYWDRRWVREASEHGHAGRHNSMCTEWSVAWAASSSPEIRARAGVGRGRWIDGDGWSAWRRGMGGGVLAGLGISSSLLRRRNKLIWRWQTNRLFFLRWLFHPFWNSFTRLPSRAVFSEPSARLFPSLPPWFRTCPNAPSFQLCLLTSWPPNYPTRGPFETVSGHVVITFCGLSKTSTFPCMPESLSFEWNRHSWAPLKQETLK